MTTPFLQHKNYLAALLSTALIAVSCSNSNNSNANGNTQNDTLPAKDTVPSPLPDTAMHAARWHRGIDISKYQGDEVAEIGPEDSLTFIICKATEGATFVDPDFKNNMNTIKSKQVLCGAYHFYHTNLDPEQQAIHFWNTIGTFKDEIHLAPVVDIEDGSMPKGTKANATKIQQDLKTFLNKLEQLCGRQPMIYTGYDFGAAYLTDKAFEQYALWLAEYTGANEPKVPATWQGKGYKIWQKKDNYTIHSTQNDFDVYYGTKAELVN